MKNERQANFELAAQYERNQWKGSLGPKREAHKRPSLVQRVARRVADVFLAAEVK